MELKSLQTMSEEDFFALWIRTQEDREEAQARFLVHDAVCIACAAEAGRRFRERAEK